MKQILVAMMMVIAGSVLAASTLPLAEARAQIGAVVSEPAKMKAIMKQLAAEDQKQFVAEVNAAVAKLPASQEEKTAIFLNVNRAALSGAAKGNLATIVAEVYATVPVESLTVISERFAADAFNRAANPKVTYTDEHFQKIAAGVMEKINERVASADNGDVRSGFAALMMIRASNSSSPAMVDAITAMMPASAQATARTEWFPAALADTQSYEPMLGMADAGEQPQPELVLTIAGAQNFEALLGDLSGMAVDPTAIVGQQTPIVESIQNAFKDPVPHLNPGSIDNHPGEGEPQGYQWQEI